MKKAFTIIELIFVIIILGVLSAVALPKFIGIAEQAKEGNLKSFVGTLNRTVGPTLWSKAIGSGKGGDISNLDSLNKYTDIPDEISENNISYCDDKEKFKIIAIAPSDKIGGEYNYYILCKTGTNIKSPKFILGKSKSSYNLGDINDTNMEIISN